MRVRVGYQGQIPEDEILGEELCQSGKRVDRGKPQQLQSDQQGWTTEHVLDWFHGE